MQCHKWSLLNLAITRKLFKNFRKISDLLNIKLNPLKKKVNKYKLNPLWLTAVIHDLQYQCSLLYLKWKKNPNFSFLFIMKKIAILPVIGFNLKAFKYRQENRKLGLYLIRNIPLNVDSNSTQLLHGKVRAKQAWVLGTSTTCFHGNGLKLAPQSHYRNQRVTNNNILSASHVLK